MFSDLLKELRKKHNNISQAALAKKLQVSQQAVGRWEKGLNMPDHDTLRKLALFFRVSTDYLLEMPDIEDPKEPLTQDERELLDGYRDLDTWGQRALLCLMQNELLRMDGTAPKTRKKAAAM